MMALRGHLWHRLHWLRGLLLLLAIAPHCAMAATPKDSPAMKMLQCDVCTSVMATLSKDVKYLVESESMWESSDLNSRIMVSCSDPALPSGAMQEACGYFVGDYRKIIARDVALRWDEDSEEFEEDIVPREFCLKIGACKEGHKSISEMISQSDRKDKALKEEKEEKDRNAKKKPTKA
mmetsp:Transcript_96359/g.272534  ORF Transcript_96359/g.272534 Transcript_96359/m.272534 type:complete len:178 (-) Transcript_96359:149-682(-)